MTSLTSGGAVNESMPLLNNANFVCPSGNTCTSPCYKCASDGVENATEKLRCVSNSSNKLYSSNSVNSQDSNSHSSPNTCKVSGCDVQVEEVHFVQEVVVARRKQSLSINKVKRAVFRRPKNWKTNEIPLQEVSKHNSPEDCWIIAKNKVYNATPFLKIHPGGVQSILRRAGGVKDCSIDFDFHSSNGRKVWQQYQIGIVEGSRQSCQIM